MQRSNVIDRISTNYERLDANMYNVYLLFSFHTKKRKNKSVSLQYIQDIT